MSREKKRGTSGNARAYITRAKALKKLQLSLAEFRRLCIVKGIYPRDPKKKVDGSDKTYYLRKDIDFLAHDRLIGTLRKQNAHKKKVIKARARRERDQLRQLAISAPKTRLDHVVLERYPSFADALRELDDPLCVVGLFAHMPAVNKFGIVGHKVNLCRRLLNEFHHVVAVSGALRKCFVSIKGYYYQAVVHGEIITWMTPHRFTQVLPKDVDYSVMLTFLDLYKCILSFVNFRLYASRNLVYPPKFSRDLLNTALELGAVVESESKRVVTNENTEEVVVKEVPTDKLDAVAKTAANMADEEDEEEDEEANQVEEEQDEEEDDSQKLTVFRGCSVVIGRETPYNELEFVLRAAGVDKVTREGDLPSEDTENRLEGYTHWIIDRPVVRGPQVMNVEYVQPQYIFDSINTGVRLPTSLYGVGRKLPPHLSPFVGEDADGGYRPWYKDILERIKNGDESVVKEAAAVIYEQEKAEQEDGIENEDAGKTDEVEEENMDDNVVEVEMEVEEKQDKAKSKKKKRKRGKSKKTVVVENEVNDDEPKKKRTRKSGGTEEVEEEDERIEDEIEPVEENENEEDEDDEQEGDDEEDNKENSANNEKDLARVMMSRKKMRKYQHIVREQEEQKALKDKLTAKRKAIEAKGKGRKSKNKKTVV